MSRPSDFDIITQGFIQYLEKTGNLNKLPQLAKEQVRASKILFDPNLAIVQTVVKLSPQEIKAIQTKLEAMFRRPIVIRNQINPNLLGGMLIRLGDQVIDLSLKARLKTIREELLP